MPCGAIYDAAVLTDILAKSPGSGSTNVSVCKSNERHLEQDAHGLVVWVIVEPLLEYLENETFHGQRASCKGRSERMEIAAAR